MLAGVTSNSTKISQLKIILLQQFQRHGASSHNCLQVLMWLHNDEINYAKRPSKLSKENYSNCSGVLCIMLSQQVSYRKNSWCEVHFNQLRKSLRGRSALSLLIKQKELAIEEEMRQKQQEFSVRMENCILRRNQLKKKKERVHKQLKLMNNNNIITSNITLSSCS